MRSLFGIAIIPLICLGVLILTAAVIIFALRRGTRTINEQVQDLSASKVETPSANTRWARGDLQGKPRSKKKEKPMKICPACGGENDANSKSCVFCGTTL